MAFSKSILELLKLTTQLRVKNKVENFIKKGFPEEWFDYANALKDAAQTLWKSHSKDLTVYIIEGKYYSRKLYSRT